MGTLARTGSGPVSGRPEEKAIAISHMAEQSRPLKVSLCGRDIANAPNNARTAIDAAASVRERLQAATVSGRSRARKNSIGATKAAMQEIFRSVMPMF